MFVAEGLAHGMSYGQVNKAVFCIPTIRCTSTILDCLRPAEIGVVIHSLPLSWLWMLSTVESFNIRQISLYQK